MHSLTSMKLQSTELWYTAFDTLSYLSINLGCMRELLELLPPVTSDWPMNPFRKCLCPFLGNQPSADLVFAYHLSHELVLISTCTLILWEGKCLEKKDFRVFSKFNFSRWQILDLKSNWILMISFKQQAGHPLNFFHMFQVRSLS